jgi:hypothetical protein
MHHNLNVKQMDKVIYFSYDRDENGFITVFHLPTGDLALYEDKQDVLWQFLTSQGYQLYKKK